MPIFPFHLYLDSPAFIAGTDKNKPEMRAASIRGQLRYWLRAMLGATKLDNVKIPEGKPKTHIEKLHIKESEIFGSTDLGSQVGIQVYPLVADVEKVPMLPHRPEQKKQGWQPALSEQQFFELNLVTRPGIPLSPEMLHALKIWSLLGGIGRRSRRMFGAVRILATTETSNDWYAQPDNVAMLKRTINDVLDAAIPKKDELPDYHNPKNIPKFPVLHRTHAWVMVGRESFADALDANRALFGLLRSAKFRSDTNFGHTRGGRRASPLIAQVREIDGEYYPIFTVLRSRPDEKINWKQVNDFMQDAKTQFSAETAWGGELK